MAAAPPVNHILIKDMKPAQRGIDCDCIVLQKESDPVTTREGDTIYKFLIADRTGVILLSIWNALGQYVKNGDILRLCGCECKIRKGQLQLSALKSSKMKRLGQDTFLYVEKPNFTELSMQSQQPPLPQHQQQYQQQLQSPQQQPAINPMHAYQHQQQQQQRMSPYSRSRPPPRGGYRGGRGRDPRQRGRSTPQPQ